MLPQDEARPEQSNPETEAPHTIRASLKKPLEPGLYLVGTPIGNLEDITLRALHVLELADSIACEDTRETRKLLQHFGIRTPMVSYHAHNELERSASLLEELRQGKRIAIVTDAGMPGISDPGVLLAKAAIEAGIRVTPIPGANAAISALVASGLGTDRFSFCGFLPSKAGERRTALEQMAAIDQAATLIFYEAPHRILETLGDVSAVWGAHCRVVVARELTKLHEEFLRGTAAEVRTTLAARERIRGEITLLVEATPAASQSAAESAESQSISSRLDALQKSDGLDEKEALKRIARERGIGKSDAYRELQRERAKL